jgi:hypothetical protein
MVPVAWVNAAVDVAAAASARVPLRLRTASSSHFSLQLSGSWLGLAGASQPFELRNAWVTNQNVPVAQAGLISVTSAAGPTGLAALPRRLPRPMQITREMRVGPVPANFTARARAAAAPSAKPGLVLVHGYCAQQNPYAERFGTFTDAYLLDDLVCMCTICSKHHMLRLVLTRSRRTSPVRTMSLR